MKIMYHFIINEHAGNGRGKKTSATILQLAKNRISYQAHYSKYPGHVYEIMEELKPILLPYQEELSAQEIIYPLLVVLGGDGTLHEVMNSLYPNHLEVPVGYIPTGSGNDFSRAIGLTRNLIKDFEKIITATKPKKVNLITYHEGISNRRGVLVNNLGIGLDASIVHAANTSQAKRILNFILLGHFSYMASIFKELFCQKSFPVRIEGNGQQWHLKKDFLFSITNHPYFGGGIPIAPGASPFEEGFDVVILERIPLIKIFYLLILLMKKKHLKNKHIIHLKGDRLHLVSVTPQYAQLDGEVWEKQSYDFYFSVTEGYIWF